MRTSEGIGFLDPTHGWTGGWGDQFFVTGFTSETADGGDTWADANHVGRFLDRFRFVREPELVGACGDTVYKYAPATVPGTTVEPEVHEVMPRSSLPARIWLPARDYSEPGQVDVWDRFGRHLTSMVIERADGEDEVELPLGAAGSAADPTGGVIIYRVSTGDEVTSSAMILELPGEE